MRERLQTGLQWFTGIAVAVTVWWGWQLQSERVVLYTLTRTATDARQRITQLRTELSHVQRAAHGTLDSLARATHTFQRVVQQLRHQELAVTLTCQEQTTMTLATLPLVALPCQVMMPPTGLLAVVEVMRAIEQTQVVLPRVRLHTRESRTVVGDDFDVLADLHDAVVIHHAAVSAQVTRSILHHDQCRNRFIQPRLSGWSQWVSSPRSV